MKSSVEVNAMIMSYIQHKRSPIRQESYNEELALEEILYQLRPMLIKRCRHYFGYITEDLLQSGYLELMERMAVYDENRTDIPVLGYLNRMISCHYFSMKRKQSRDKDRFFVLEKEILEQLCDTNIDSAAPYCDLDELLCVLNPMERRLIVDHILMKKSLKSICISMEISYSYAKKLKSNSLLKLKQRYLTLNKKP